MNLPKLEKSISSESIRDKPEISKLCNFCPLPKHLAHLSFPSRGAACPRWRSPSLRRTRCTTPTPTSSRSTSLPSPAASASSPTTSPPSQSSSESLSSRKLHSMLICCSQLCSLLYCTLLEFHYPKFRPNLTLSSPRSGPAW